MIKADVGDTKIVAKEIKDLLGKRMHNANVTSFLVSALIAPLIACTTPEVAGIEPTYVTSENWKRVAGCSDTPFKSVRYFEIRNARRVPSIVSQRAYAGLLKAAQIFSGHPAVNWRSTYPSSVAKIDAFLRLAGAKGYRKSLADFKAVLFDLDSFEVPGTLWPGIPRPAADVDALANLSGAAPRQSMGA